MMVNLSREISCKIRIFLMMVSWRVKEESDVLDANDVGVLDGT